MIDSIKQCSKKIIGITGGIGSGKTMVLDFIQKNYSVQVIEADKVGHELQQPGEVGYTEIIKCFGNEILDEPKINAPINRKRLGEIVFSDEIKLKTLNSIMHPLIHNRILDMINNSKYDIILIEAAILTESSLMKLIDELWYIYADKNVRIERLQKYRNISREKAENIMNNQPTEDEIKALCDVFIDNSGHMEDTYMQIKTAFHKT